MSSSSTTETFHGVVTRICSFKYGFIKSDLHKNIFFHFSELSDDAKAFVEAGSKVIFHVQKNDYAKEKNKAIKVEVVSGVFENEYKNLSGEVTGTTNLDRGFCFIKNGDSTYLFHSAQLVDDDESTTCDNKREKFQNAVKDGYKVIFDAEWNHKYNPPKPFAVNVRILPEQNTGLVDSAFDEPISPLNATSPLCRRSSVTDRATALRDSGPMKRWSRTTQTSDSQPNKPSGGLRLTVTVCKFGRKCTRKDCWFEHKKGREMEDGDSSIIDSDTESSDDEGKVASFMGKASLRLLVNAVFEEDGKKSYIAVRNTLQKAEYLGRPLTREERNSVGDILEELTNANSPTMANLSADEPKRTSMSGSRGTSRFLSGRSSFGGRVSLSDLCRDPSLHSRLSAANARGPVCP